jgi:uncharacterized protein YfdQ (DUF2303 family)
MTCDQINPTVDAQAIIDTAIASAQPTPLDTGKLYARTVPEGAEGEVIDLEPYADAPRRMRGTVHLQTVEALTAYTSRHDNPDCTTLWIDGDRHQVVAVLDDHSEEQPAWGEHRAVLTLQVTDAWRHWTALDGKLMAQEAFAGHIEDGLPDIASPDGADMLEIAQSIQGTTKAEFKAAHRLSSGAVGVQYVEEQTAKAGRRGELEIPERFTLAISPFVGADTHPLGARLRYRIKAGELTLGYRLDRPGDVLRDALEGIAGRLRSTFGEHRVFAGRPREV